MADLSTLAPKHEKLPVKIKNFDDTDSGIVIFITSPLSASYIKRKTALYNSVRAAKFANPAGLTTAEQDVDFNDKMTASIIVGWENLQENGKDLPYSEATAYRLVKQYPLLAEQVRVAADDQAAFFTDTPKPSAPTQKNTSKRTKRPKTA